MFAAVLYDQLAEEDSGAADTVLVGVGTGAGADEGVLTGGAGAGGAELDIGAGGAGAGLDIMGDDCGADDGAAVALDIAAGAELDDELPPAWLSTPLSGRFRLDVPTRIPGLETWIQFWLSVSQVETSRRINSITTV